MLEFEEITEILTELRLGEETHDDNPWNHVNEKEGGEENDGENSTSFH